MMTQTPKSCLRLRIEGCLASPAAIVASGTLCTPLRMGRARSLIPMLQKAKGRPRQGVRGVLWQAAPHLLVVFNTFNFFWCHGGTLVTLPLAGLRSLLVACNAKKAGQTNEGRGREQRAEPHTPSPHQSVWRKEGSLMHKSVLATPRGHPCALCNSFACCLQVWSPHGQINTRARGGPRVVVRGPGWAREGYPRAWQNRQSSRRTKGAQRGVRFTSVKQGETDQASASTKTCMQEGALRLRTGN